MDLLIERIVDGLNNGVVYGFLALAMVCVYRATKTLNLAQGEMAMFCGFIAYAIHATGAPITIAVTGAVLAGAVGGAAIERVMIAPLGQGAHYPVLLVTIALFLMLNAGAGMIWGGDPLPFPALVPSGPNDFVSFLGTRLRYTDLLTFGVLCVVLVALYMVFRYTKIGLAMRVVSSNPESAQLVGMRIHRIHSLGWALAGGVGALVAVLVAPTTALSPGMMFNFLLYAAAAATLGGFESPGGAVLAGLIIGVGENLIASYVGFVGEDMKQAVALVALLAVLMVKPTGLFGSAEVERV